MVVDEAHRLGLPVAAHAHALGSIRDAVTAGVDTIEHASFQTSAGITAHGKLFDAIAASGIYVSSTLGTPTDRMAGMPAKMRGQLRTLRSLYRELHRRGARIIVGCDTGVGPFKPHDSLPYAVAELGSLGIFSDQALAAVTSVAARACGVADRKGRIVVGADADLLVLRADPRPDPARMLDVEAVFRLGCRIR